MIKVAFQGERGAYSEQAARLYFKKDINVLACQSFTHITQAVAEGFADFAILPLENSSAGSVLPAYDALLDCDLHIVGELLHPVHHCLLGTKNSKIDQVQKAISHPQGLAQSARFLQDHHIQPEPFYDTAGAAKHLSENPDETISAIASELCAEIYDLKILAQNIEDLGNNQTRFVVLSREAIKAESDDLKTSLIFSTVNKPGALYQVLSIFANAGIDLAKIESRPDRLEPFCYQFILDFKHTQSDDIDWLINAIQPFVKNCRVLGCYQPG